MILIVDGFNLFLRSYAVHPATDADGEPAGGIVGFLQSLKRIMEDTDPERVIVCWDGEGGSRRRRGIYKEYKEGRKVRLNRTIEHADDQDGPRNLEAQLVKLRAMLKHLGVLQVRPDLTEADDMIALLCNTTFFGVKKVVVTSDKDMLQLVDAKTEIYSPARKEFVKQDMVYKEHGVLPENWIFLKCLMGDKGDNVPGIEGIGETTALKLFPFLRDLRKVELGELLKHATENVDRSAKYKRVVDGWDRVAENFKLMRLDDPIISAQSASVIVEGATKDPSFQLTEFKLSLVRYGLQVVDPSFLSVFQGYKSRSKKLAPPAERQLL